MSNHTEQMPRRMAQVLAAIVFLANGSDGKIPSAEQLCSWIGKRLGDANVWLGKFYSDGGYFVADDFHLGLYLSQLLATTAEEANIILAIYSEIEKMNENPTLKRLRILLPEYHGLLRLDIMNILRKKWYVDGDRRIGFTLTKKALFQIPYLHILARDFQPARRQILHR